MSIEEFQDHWADWRLNPWGAHGDDLRQALLRSQCYHQFRGEGAPLRKLEEFLIERPRARADTDVTDLRRQFRGWGKKR